MRNFLQKMWLSYNRNQLKLNTRISSLIAICENSKFLKSLKNQLKMEDLEHFNVFFVIFMQKIVSSGLPWGLIGGSFFHLRIEKINVFFILDDIASSIKASLCIFDQSLHHIWLKSDISCNFKLLHMDLLSKLFKIVNI